MTTPTTPTASTAPWERLMDELLLLLPKHATPPEYYVDGEGTACLTWQSSLGFNSVLINTESGFGKVASYAREFSIIRGQFNLTGVTTTAADILALFTPSAATSPWEQLMGEAMRMLTEQGIWFEYEYEGGVADLTWHSAAGTHAVMIEPEVSVGKAFTFDRGRIDLRGEFSTEAGDPQFPTASQILGLF